MTGEPLALERPVGHGTGIRIRKLAPEAVLRVGLLPSGADDNMARPTRGSGEIIQRGSWYLNMTPLQTVPQRFAGLATLILLSLTGACDQRGETNSVNADALDEGPSAIVHVEQQDTISLCVKAFAAAAGVSDLHDTHEDLFPAYSACSSVAEWRDAYALYPAAIDGGNPIQYARTVCANNQEALRETPMCKAVGTPPPVQTTETALLKKSSRTGLMGIPLPEGARLTGRTQGSRVEQTDPSESYSVSATAKEIEMFYKRVMPDYGWTWDGSSGLFYGFVKGSRVVGVWVNRNGGRFTLMGS